MNIITCVADGAVISADLERLDTDGFNDEYIMFVTDIGDIFSASGSFPYQIVEGEGPVGATLISEPIPGARCLQIRIASKDFFDLPSPRFSYTVTW